MKANSSTKRSLIISIIALCMCFAMLIGTTFAWFTDSVTSSGNVIKSGTLDVGFYWAKGTEDPAKANWIEADKGALFSEETLWEPGYAETKHIKITNEGTLALAYKLAIIPHGEVSELADVIDVYYYDDNGAVQQTNRIVDNHDDLNYVGTLRQFINKGIAEGDLAAETEYTATFVFKMHDEAGNEYQNMSIGSDFSIQLIATQYTAEEDSFDNQYDVNAFTTVSTVEGLRAAINSAVDTTTIFVQAGTYNVSSVIDIADKEIDIVGLGVVDFVKVPNSTHIFNIRDNSNVTIKNFNMDGNGLAREGVYVRNNTTVTLNGCYIGNTGGKDVMIDEASDAAKSDIATTSTVNLVNSHVEDVAMCASPVTSVASTKDNKACFNFDAESTVDNIEKQAINLKPENCYINGDNSSEYDFVFYVANDAQLTSALARIHADSKYYNKEVLVKLAANEYSGDYTINQYPLWNGENGHGNYNNPYNGGVEGAPVLNLTIVGETVSTFARGAARIPTAIFTGSVTVNGFGNSQTGFATSNENPAPITFKAVAFKGEYDGSEDFVGNSIVFAAMNAADNVFFEGCHFANATHITLGSTTPHNVGSFEFTDCTFTEGGCISGRFTDVTVKGGVVDGATKGFINQQKSDNGVSVTVEGLTANVGAYLVRTNGNVNINIADSDIVVTESEGSDSVIVSRGAGDDVDFVDCELNDSELISGIGANSSDVKIEYSDEIGNIFVKDAINNTLTLEEVSATAPEYFVIPEGVTALGNQSFKYSNVKTVVIPATVTDFGASGVSATNASGGAFKDSAVEKVVLPEGMTVIPAAAFNGATNLKEVNIPSTVTAIGVNAFRSSALTTLTIPATVEAISYGAFRDMTALTTVTIEGDVHIPDYAFRGCANLRTVYINGENATVGSNMAFANGSSNNPNTNNITFYVKNATVAKQVATCMGVGTNFYINIANATENYWIVNSEDTLKAAIEKGGSVLLEKDIKLTSAVVIPADANLTIDLNGKNIAIDIAYDSVNYTASSAIVNNGTLTLTGNGTVKAINNYTVRNSGTMVIDGITVENGIMNFDTLTIQSGNFSNSRSGKHVIYSNSANLTINGGTFYNGNPGNAAIFSYAGEVVINDGEFSIADGTATQGWTSCLIDAQGNAKYTINGGDFYGEFRDYNKNTTIYGGTYTHDSAKNFVATGYKAVSYGDKFIVLTEDVDAVVTNTAELVAAINSDADLVYVAAGNYDLRFTNNTAFNVDGMTFKALGETAPVFNISITSTEVWYGRIQGDDVTFDGITFTSSVGTTGKATYNNCKFASWAICAVSGETYYNNCEIAILNTSTDFNSGNVYVKDSVVTGAEYSFRSSDSVMNFENCEIGELIIWSNKTVLENSKVDLNNIVLKGDAVKTTIIDGAYAVGSAAELIAARNTINANGGGKIVLLADITVTENWDSRNNGNYTVPVEIDGLGHTLKFTAEVHDGGNHSCVFRFMTTATVKNLTFDMSEVVKGSALRMRAITTYTGDITVTNCTFIGNDAYTLDEAIVIAETIADKQVNVTAVITDCSFINWNYGVSDNMNAKEVKSITVSDCYFENASVGISAYENVTFTKNEMTGAGYKFSITSYTAKATAKAVATGNTFAGTPEKVEILNLDSANVTAQDGVALVKK